MEANHSRKLFFNKLVENISQESDCDIFICNSKMGRGLDDLFIEMLSEQALRKNALLILVTEGGDPDAAYRIARAFQQKYEKFSVCVAGYCKSAGTLLTLGADELIMTDLAELGPLDIQLAKEDAIGENLSVLAIPHALKTLQGHAFSCFEESLLEIIRRSRGRISTKTASKIATELSIGLFSPVFQQLDPLNIGEMTRANSIALSYGLRLLEKYQNASVEKLGYLITNYPSHGFVIDREEASQLFERVRVPTEQESMLLGMLGDVATRPQPDGATARMLNKPVVNQQNSPNIQTKEDKEDGKVEDINAAKSKPRAKPVRRARARRSSPATNPGSGTGDPAVGAERESEAG